MNRFVMTDVTKPEGVHHCMGCFGCFVKTPGKCVIPDACQEQGTKMAHCDEFIIVSECVYGGYSPDLKIQLTEYFHIFMRTLPSWMAKCTTP